MYKTSPWFYTGIGLLLILVVPSALAVGNYIPAGLYAGFALVALINERVNQHWTITIEDLRVKLKEEIEKANSVNTIAKKQIEDAQAIIDYLDGR